MEPGCRLTSAESSIAGLLVDRGLRLIVAWRTQGDGGFIWWKCVGIRALSRASASVARSCAIYIFRRLLRKTA